MFEIELATCSTLGIGFFLFFALFLQHQAKSQLAQLMKLATIKRKLEENSVSQI
ncbi:MAG: hypothetical protein LBC89_04700 [Bacteroidales bacterium]|nr:hypothetical protein [Bacteroidales bacterium]